MKKHIITKTIFLILLIISTALWLVNIEFAVRLYHPEFSLILKYIPANIFNILELLSSDFSTVSTLIPVLICLFPIVSLNKLQKNYNTEITETFPYPENFPFFLVMLGLAGTLYGLLIGLDSSGLSALDSETSGAPEIRETIDRLLDGTATALLSSLVGIVGAFIVVKPVPMIFQTFLHIKDDEDNDIEQVIENLTSQFTNLNKVVENFSETIEKYNDTNIPQNIQNIEKAFFKLLEEQSINTEFLQHIHKQQELTNNLLEPLANLEKLSLLSKISEQMNKMDKLENINDKLDKLENINDKMDRLATLETIETNQNEQIQLSKSNNELVQQQNESNLALKVSVEEIPVVINQILKQDKEFHDKTSVANSEILKQDKEFYDKTSVANSEILKQDKEFHDKTSVANSEILKNLVENKNKNDEIIAVLKDTKDDKDKQRNRILKNIKTYIDSF